MKVVTLVPRKEDGGRRDIIWERVRERWERLHPGYRIFEGHDDHSPVFSMARARNNAARRAGDWDVALVLDADTMAHPDAVREAVHHASHTHKVWVAGDMRMRMDERSSDRLLKGYPTFPRPEGERHPKGNVLADTCYGEPSSGVIAVGRELWEHAGGYFEKMNGWGWEDLVFLTQCCVVGDGMDWVRDEMLLHIYHERTPWTDDTSRNEQLYKDFHNVACRSKEQAKMFLTTKGHDWDWPW